ncbi:hypothetical protein EC957_001797 [Mortierella hygrophila]|uniref:Uncharacterized protein n=1 Tax=Mortierella hygrophila TaxID=979708 RepID=A0A9P6K233_9FUNG|nr:hypothetical protein EC957_001797 [Mortierella hygrophila]
MDENSDGRNGANIIDLKDAQGEKALKASKIMRGMQREEYGEPLDAGWKVDCVFMFDGIELSNIELKSQNASPRDVNLNIWVRISIKVDASAYWDSVLTCRHKQSVRYARNIL